LETPAPYSLSNKSFVVNSICVITIIVGHLFIPAPFQNHILNMGYFGFSGAITNWLAIHMLFEKIPGLYGSGIIPLKFESFKNAIRQMIMTQFFSAENIQKFLEGSSEEGGGQLEPILENLNYDLVFDALVDMIMTSKFGSMLSMFGGAKSMESMRPTFCTRIKERLIELSRNPDFLAQVAPDSATTLHEQWSEKIAGMVDARLEELTPQMVKEIIQVMIRSHLGWLVVWGGVFGGLIGLITSFIL